MPLSKTGKKEKIDIFARGCWTLLLVVVLIQVVLLVANKV
jgi:hypothetical protein